MLDTIGAFGSGIGTNLLSDSLSKKLEAFKDKKAIASFTQSLRDWEIEFEKQNDGTIITNGAFYSHVKYVVKNEYAESLICALSGVDFMGRWMPEAQSNSAMYNKEYYWSDAHTFFNNPYYCGLEWVNIDSDHLNCVFPEKVLIPVKQYYSERKGELNSLNSEIASIYWHKPCEEMYTKLQLKYLKGSNSSVC